MEYILLITLIFTIIFPVICNCELPDKGGDLPMSPGYFATYSITIDGIPEIEHLEPDAEVRPYPLMNRPIYTFKCTPASIANLLDNAITEPLSKTTFKCFVTPPIRNNDTNEQAKFTWIPVDGPPFFVNEEKYGFNTAELVIKGNYRDEGTYGYEMMLWFNENKVVFAVKSSAWWIEDGEHIEGDFKFLLKILDGEEKSLEWN